MKIILQLRKSDSCKTRPVNHLRTSIQNSNGYVDARNEHGYTHTRVTKLFWLCNLCLD